MFFRDAEFPQRGNSARLYCSLSPAKGGGTVPARNTRVSKHPLSPILFPMYDNNTFQTYFSKALEIKEKSTKFKDVGEYKSGKKFQMRR